VNLKLEAFNLKLESFNLKLEAFNLKLEAFNLKLESFNLNFVHFFLNLNDFQFKIILIKFPDLGVRKSTENDDKRCGGVGDAVRHVSTLARRRYA